MTKADEKAFEWCLSHVLDPDEIGGLIERPRSLPLFSMKGVSAPPDLVKETVIIGNVPDAIKAYRGLWISPIAGKSFFPYAAYVERLTATEMTIALLSKTPDDLRQRPPESLRHKLTWNGRSFEGKTENLLGITGGITLGVAISASGEAMGLSFANDREAHILGCLISSKHY